MRKFIWLGLLPFLMIGCLERELVTNPADSGTVELQAKKVPTVVTPGKSYAVMVMLKGEPDQQIPSVTLDILSENAQTKIMTLQCYDDGDKDRLGNGDVVAHDGIYSQKLVWPSAYSGSDKLLFQFSVPLSDLTALKIPVTSLAFNPPVIRDIICPDSLVSGFSGQIALKAIVSDSSGLEDIVAVWLSGLQNGKQIFSDTLFDDGSRGDALAHDGVCTKVIDKTFSAGKQGEYTLQFQARDRAGLVSAVATRKMLIRNGRPLVSQVQMIKDLSRPASGTVTFLIEATVEDPQGLADIRSAKLSWKKPDNTFPAASPYALYDNGLAFDLSKWDYGYRGDLVANDGIYSIRGVFDSDDLLGDYTLGFQIEDLVGNKSVEVISKVTLRGD